MNEIFTSDLSKKSFPANEKVSLQQLRLGLFEYIRDLQPELERSSFISKSELNELKVHYISKFLLRDIKNLSVLEDNVVSSLANQTVISDMIDDDDPRSATVGQRLADKVSGFGGSWTFIISFLTFLLLWIIFNMWWMHNKSFDPYPFILLNLILSCLAALQAPIIMMSQNRQEEKDRERSKMDYMVNLKSELEIRILHEKLDQVLSNQEDAINKIMKIEEKINQ